MLQEKTLFGEVDKVREAIELLKKYEPEEGYYVCFSGGKDSVVVLDLVKRAGVKFDAHYNVMTIEPPELIPFIQENYPEVEMTIPEKDLYQLIIENGIPPLRQARYCHRELKAPFGQGRFKVTGIRAEESRARTLRNKLEVDRKIGGHFLNIIHNWTEAEVWEYIHTYKVKYCELYDKGRKRLGCLFCPFGSQSQMQEDLKNYPEIAENLIIACQKAIDRRFEKTGKRGKYDTGESMFYWWINHDKSKKRKEGGMDNIFE